jgi:hypothetical protein
MPFDAADEQVQQKREGERQDERNHGCGIHC